MIQVLDGRFGSIAVAAIIGLGTASQLAGAQTPYRDPPPEVAKILDTQPFPFSSVSPDGKTLLLLEREGLPPMSEQARPMVRLAGRRVDPARNGLHGARFSMNAITIQPLDGGASRSLQVPDGRIGFPEWNVDGRRFVFTLTLDDGIELWMGDAQTGESTRLADDVNGLSPGAAWLPDGERVLVGLIPSGRGAAPQRSGIPTGPVIQENLGGKPAPVRTYQDLLRDAHDEALFDHFFTAQLVTIHSRSGTVTPLGNPGVFTSAEASPSGRYFLVERVRKPYSYLVPIWSFSQDVEIWNDQGERASMLLTLPLAERVPIQGVITGPRRHEWAANRPATVVWAEALDGGDPRAETDQRDKIMMLDPPFTGDATHVLTLEDRYSGLTWVGGGALAMAREYDRDERWVRTWMVDLASPETDARLVHERNVQDRYADPGRPVMTLNGAGRSVAMVEGGAMYLTGRGSTPEGDRPFFDRMSITGSEFEIDRLWRNEGESYESVVDVLTDDGSLILTRYETPTTPPNYLVRNLNEESRSSVTNFEHPAPELLDVRKELVKYERPDGVELSATLYLPAGYDESEPLPLVVWAYPFEFNDARTASQVRGSPHRFTMFSGSSHRFLLTQGYAIMDSASMPIIGADPNTVNDTFIEQLVMSAQAAIDYAAHRGVGDPNRVGVGGHSYGAFMTANLLAHCDLFQAGIARSGAYNRTLTPFGFQAERRPLWEAKSVYFTISPFMHADKINEPMLMIHGQKDNNSGTFPIQSERMYHAIKGHGGTVRLVMLPEESHGYLARESVGHTLAEMIDWFDRYVKYASQSPRMESQATGGE